LFVEPNEAREYFNVGWGLGVIIPFLQILNSGNSLLGVAHHFHEQVCKA
jgi:hypothetical protein